MLRKLFISFLLMIIILSTPFTTVAEDKPYVYSDQDLKKYHGTENSNPEAIPLDDFNALLVEGTKILNSKEPLSYKCKMMRAIADKIKNVEREGAQKLWFALTDLETKCKMAGY